MGLWSHRAISASELTLVFQARVGVRSFERSRAGDYLYYLDLSMHDPEISPRDRIANVNDRPSLLARCAKERGPFDYE